MESTTARSRSVAKRAAFDYVVQQRWRGPGESGKACGGWRSVQKDSDHRGGLGCVNTLSASLWIMPGSTSWSAMCRLLGHERGALLAWHLKCGGLSGPVCCLQSGQPVRSPRTDAAEPEDKRRRHDQSEEPPLSGTVPCLKLLGFVPSASLQLCRVNTSI